MSMSISSANKGRLALKVLIGLVLAVIPHLCHAQSVQPFQGIANPQFLTNAGLPLSTGAVYFYLAGTTTQTSTYTDSSGATVNANPLPLNSAGRATSGGIWLLNQLYKIVLCSSATDGATCASGDTLVSVDNVPGFLGSASGGSASSPFISATANPATTGILRLASADSVCWRNAANNANLCISKDTNDLITWAGGSLKLPEVVAPAGVSTFDLLWADSTGHRFKMSNNAGVADVVAGATTTDTFTNKTYDTGGAGNVLKIAGTQITGVTPAVAILVGNTATTTINGTACTITSSCTTLPAVVYSTASASTNANILATTMVTVGASNATYRVGYALDVSAVGASCTGSTSIVVSITWQDPNAVALQTQVFLTDVLATNNNGILGATSSLFAANPRANAIRAKAGTVIQYSVTYTIGTGCAPGPQYTIFPILEQLTSQ